MIELKNIKELLVLREEEEVNKSEAEKWENLYRRAIDVANGLTNYVEDRPELRRAEKELAVLTAEARSIK